MSVIVLGGSLKYDVEGYRCRGRPCHKTGICERSGTFDGSQDQLQICIP